MKPLALVALLLAGCHRDAQHEARATPGSRIEAAAAASGLLVDPAGQSLTGSWARDTDHLCVLPPPTKGDNNRIGVLVDYGDGQGCAGSGTVTRAGDRLFVRLGTCRVTAAFDGTRITFPGEVSAACESLCRGRASLAALSVERLSDSASEAATLRTPGGRTLCPG